MQVYKWGFVSRPSGQMVWKAFSYHMFQRGNRQLCRQMKRDKRNLHPLYYHPRPTLQSQGEKYSFCGATGTSSSISTSTTSCAGSTANSTITSVRGIGNNNSCSSSRPTSSEISESIYSFNSKLRATLEYIRHSNVLIIHPSSTGNCNLFNFFNSEDMKDLLCVLEDLD